MKILWSEDEHFPKEDGKKAFEELVKLINEREDTYQKSPDQFLMYRLVLGHRWLTGAPMLRHPLISSVIEMRKWERWNTLRQVLRVQLMDYPPEKPTGDIRAFAGFGFSSWTSVSHPLVDEYWEWRRKEHLYPDPFDKPVHFYKNSICMDLDNLNSREFIGDTNITSGLHFWEIQLLAPCLLTYPDALRIEVGIVINADEDLYKYILTNKGDLLFRAPKARGRYLHKFCSPIYTGDRIGVAYDGSTDHLRFVVNDSPQDMNFVIRPMTEFKKLKLLCTSIRILPFVKVYEGCISFSLHKKKTFGRSLVSLSSEVVMAALFERYYHSDDHERWLQPMWFDKDWLWIKRVSLVTRIKSLPIPDTVKSTLEGLLPPKTNY